MKKQLRVYAALFAVGLIFIAAKTAIAGTTGIINGYQAICNPNAPNQCAAIDANGELPTTDINPNDWTYAPPVGGISNTTTAVTIRAAQTGLKNYVTACQISSTALGAATELAIRDGAGGTVLWRINLATAGLVGGESIHFATPLRSTAGNLLEVVTLTASVTGNVYVNCQGFSGL